jgi:RNA polymerase sigma factor (sigma-70 family)
MHMTDRKTFDVVFRRLFDEQYSSLFRYLDRLSGDPDLAADLAQEAFVRLYRRGEVPEDARAWLGTVATNLFRDERRRSSRRLRLLSEQPPELTLGAPAPAPDAGAISVEQRESVRSALDRLSLRDRQMLLLRHEGYSYREIAQALGVPETGVGTQLIRATAAFRAAFLEEHRAPD